MQDLLDFLLQNPWLVLLIIMGVLGNLGSSAARRQSRPGRTRSPRRGVGDDGEGPTPTRTAPRPPAEADEEEIARRIRDVLVGRPRPEAPPQRPPTVQRGRRPLVQDRGLHAEEPPAGAPAPASVDDLVSADLGRLETSDLGGLEADDLGTLTGRPSSLAESSVPAWIEVKAAARGTRRLPLGLSPRQAFLSMFILGEPRAFASYDDDPSRAY